MVGFFFIIIILPKLGLTLSWSLIVFLVLVILIQFGTKASIQKTVDECSNFAYLMQEDNFGEKYLESF